MQKLFFILTGLIFLNNAIAQKVNQPGAHAFSILIQPGTMPMDENGVPAKRKINKERFIYVVIPGKNKPYIKSISYNKTSVKWDLIGTAEKEYSFVSEISQKTTRIKPFRNGNMWRINIQEINNQNISDKAVPIIINGSVSNVPFTIILNKEIAVQGYDSY